MLLCPCLVCACLRGGCQRVGLLRGSSALVVKSNYPVSPSIWRINPCVCLLKAYKTEPFRRTSECFWALSPYWREQHCTLHFKAVKAVWSFAVKLWFVNDSSLLVLSIFLICCVPVCDRAKYGFVDKGNFLSITAFGTLWTLERSAWRTLNLTARGTLLVPGGAGSGSMSPGSLCGGLQLTTSSRCSGRTKETPVFSSV